MLVSSKHCLVTLPFNPPLHALTVCLYFLRKEHADNARPQHMHVTPQKLLTQTKLGDTHYSLEVIILAHTCSFQLYISGKSRRQVAGKNIFQSGENPVT